MNLRTFPHFAYLSALTLHKERAIKVSKDWIRNFPTPSFSLMPSFPFEIQR